MNLLHFESFLSFCKRLWSRSLFYHLCPFFALFCILWIILNFRFEPPWQAAPPMLAPWLCPSVAWRRRRRLPLRLHQNCFYNMHPIARKWACCATDATCRTEEPAQFNWLASFCSVGHIWIWPVEPLKSNLCFFSGTGLIQLQPTNVSFYYRCTPTGRGEEQAPQDTTS